MTDIKLSAEESKRLKFVIEVDVSEWEHYIKCHINITQKHFISNRVKFWKQLSKKISCRKPLLLSKEELWWAKKLIGANIRLHQDCLKDVKYRDTEEERSRDLEAIRIGKLVMAKLRLVQPAYFLTKKNPTRVSRLAPQNRGLI